MKMKSILVSLSLNLCLAGAAFGQMPSAVPSTASAKAAAEKAESKAKAGETAATAAGAKGQADVNAAKADAAEKTKAAGASAKSLLDLNTASEADLAALPGVGPDNAKKIIAARPFERKDQLVSKKIMSKDAYAKIKNLVIAKKAAPK